ncbi:MULTISPECIES: LysM peptidoglycan-binding domain-containing protein [unclassified Streptomyces]|uniref:LysM peptidoglycan-binding domain-containing protein n=1 Tax=unclassified Streptomyces TaxID=2593676 RepID=UPI00168AF359|nr:MULTISPECIES: LysM peptidoglycan-binding domain-containing protein [unclassified Streptomyces]MBD3008766.1 LysM peptidoglycan-binding domain-containing protein [Streptomyces sp. 5-10]
MAARGRHRRPRPHRVSRTSLAITAGGAGVALPLIGIGQANAASAATPTSPTPAATTVTAVTATKAQPLLIAPKAVPEPPAKAQPQAGSYTVVRGDTLSRIADRESVAGGWERLYEINRQVIGADPDLIRPGQQLTLGRH